MFGFGTSSLFETIWGTGVVLEGSEGGCGDSTGELFGVDTFFLNNELFSIRLDSRSNQGDRKWVRNGPEVDQKWNLPLSVLNMTLLKR